MDNFGKIKSTYNSILAEAISTGDENKKNEFKKYIKTIKENEALNTQFNVYYNIETKIELDKFKALEYVNECISLLDSFDREKIKEANKGLAKNIIGESFEINEIKESLYNNINTLIFTKKTHKTIDALVEAKTSIVDYILNNTKKEIAEGYGLPNSTLAEIATDKFNEEYSELDESDVNAINAVLSTNESEKEEFYKDAIKECISLVNGKISESSGEIKEKLLSTKENLLNRNYNGGTFVSDISKVIELKKHLSSN
jgi:hypothetical protein